MKVKALLLAIGLGLGGVWMCLAFPGAAQISTTPVLVRINLINADDLGRLAALEVPVYAHLTASTADYLLARLTPDEQKQVTGLGFSLTVLDPDATGASTHQQFLVWNALENPLNLLCFTLYSFVNVRNIG